VRAAEFSVSGRETQARRPAAGEIAARSILPPKPARGDVAQSHQGAEAGWPRNDRTAQKLAAEHSQQNQQKFVANGAKMWRFG